MLFKRLQWKLIAYYLAVIAVVVVVMGVSFTWFLNSFYRDNLRAGLHNQALLAGELFGRLLDQGTGAVELDALCKNMGRETGVRFTLVDTSGRVWGDSLEDPARMENHRDRPEIRQALAEGKGEATRYSATLGEDLLYLALPISGPQVGPRGVIRVAVPLAQITSATFKIKVFTAAALFTAAVAALILGFLLSRGITRPLGRVAGAARAIAAGCFDPPLEVLERDEIGQLARTVKEMGLALNVKVDQIILEKSKLETALTSADSGVILFDRDLRIELINPAAENIFGVTREEVAGVPARSALRFYSLLDNLRATTGTGEHRRFELNLFYPRDLTLQVSLAPVRDGGGAVMGVLALFHDITALRSVEKMRSEFVANVSHELRTPLTSIKGYSETILKNVDIPPDQLQDFLGIIDREAGRLSRLIDELLDLSRIEERKGIFKKQLVDLAGLAGQALEDLRETISQKEARIEELYPDNPAFVPGNPGWLRQALFNILENSLHYGGQGVTVRLSLTAEQGGRATLEIADTGPGIPASDLPHVFERFYRADKARSRRSGGTGLGLSIVKHIMEAHGADYAITSREGEGTVFRFSLPLAQRA